MSTLESYREDLLKILPESYKVLELKNEDYNCMYVRILYKGFLFAACIEIEPEDILCWIKSSFGETL